jgi:hypothetical protein
MMPGIPERRTHSYVRHGTTSLFAALDVASGFVIGKCYKRHRAAEFLDFLKQIDAQVPDGLDVHIIMDNLRNPQNRSHQSLVGTAAALPRAFHTNIGVMDQSGRALVRRAYPKEAPTWRPYLNEAIGNRHPRLHRAT